MLQLPRDDAVHECWTCPEGHRLEAEQAAGGYCMVCRALQPRGERILTCRQCKWWSCRACAGEEVSPKPPPLNGQGAATVSWLETALRAERREVLRAMERHHEAILGLSPDALLGSFGAATNGCGPEPLEPRNGHRLALGAERGDGAACDDAAPERLWESHSSRKSPERAERPPATRSQELHEMEVAAMWEGVDEVDLGVSTPGRGTRVSQQCMTDVPTTLADVVLHPVFETGFAALILGNAVVNIVELHITGRDIGHRLLLPDFPNSAPRYAYDVIFVLNMFFGSVFTLETVLKLAAFKTAFHRSAWNVFDFLLVALWILDQSGAGLVIDPMLLRLFRLGKLVRLLRIFKHFQSFEVFDSMHVLMSSIRGCWRVLLWSTLLLGSIMIIMALALSGQLATYMLDPGVSLERRRAIFRYFGTFDRAFLTCYEITLANWVPVCRTLFDDVSTTWGPVFIVYRALVGFAVVKVVTAVFMHETFKCAGADDELMIRQKGRAAAKLTHKLEKFLHSLDATGDGMMTYEKFQTALEDSRMKTWLAANQVEISKPERAWAVFAEGRDTVDVPIAEMVERIARVKGEAKHLELEMLDLKMGIVAESMASLSTRIAWTVRELQRKRQVWEREDRVDRSEKASTHVQPSDVVLKVSREPPAALPLDRARAVADERCLADERHP